MADILNTGREEEDLKMAELFEKRLEERQTVTERLGGDWTVVREQWTRTI